MKKSQKRNGKLNKTDYVFFALYIVGFLGAALIGFFSKSFFAYDIFNSLWANILYLLFISLLFITAFIQEVYTSRAISDVILNFAVFILGLVMFLLFILFGGIFTLCSLAFSAIMVIATGCRYALKLRQDQKLQPDFKRIVAVAIIPIFAMVQQFSVEYVTDKIWALSLIPAAIIFIVAMVVAILLVKDIWAKIYPGEGARIGTTICAVIVLFFVAYMYSVIAVNAVNCTFDDNPTKIECVVLEKNIRSGARTVTEFEVKITIDSKEKWINIPVADYHSITEGDTIIIDYYKGALNLPYYMYGGR